MIDLWASEPTFFWTYENLSAHEFWGYEDEIWIANRLNSVAIHATSISLDAPGEWGYGNVTLQFRPDSTGHWTWTQTGRAYEAVRADTPSHVILTGAWEDSGYRGAFVAVLPKPAGAGR